MTTYEQNIKRSVDVDRIQVQIVVPPESQNPAQDAMVLAVVEPDDGSPPFVLSAKASAVWADWPSVAAELRAKLEAGLEQKGYALKV